jgi:hypothetical protein
MLNAIQFMPAFVAPCRPEIEHRLAARSSPYLTSASSTAHPPEVTSDVTSQSPYRLAANTADNKN